MKPRPSGQLMGFYFYLAVKDASEPVTLPLTNRFSDCCWTPSRKTNEKLSHPSLSCIDSKFAKNFIRVNVSHGTKIITFFVHSSVECFSKTKRRPIHSSQKIGTNMSSTIDCCMKYISHARTYENNKKNYFILLIAIAYFKDKLFDPFADCMRKSRRQNNLCILRQLQRYNSNFEIKF